MIRWIVATRLLCPWAFSRQEYLTVFPGPPPRESSQPRNQIQVSHIAGGFFTVWGTREAQECWSGKPIPSLQDRPYPGIKPGYPHCRQILYQRSYQGSPTSLASNVHKWGQRNSERGLQRVLLRCVYLWPRTLLFESYLKESHDKLLTDETNQHNQDHLNKCP